MGEKGILHDPTVSANTSLVAGQMQGLVIKFVSAAIARLTSDGCCVVVNGLGPTAKYISTPHRYELVLDYQELLGRRLAAQRIADHALGHIQLHCQSQRELAAQPTQVSPTNPSKD